MQPIRVALFSPRNKPLFSTIITLTIQPKYEFTLADAATLPLAAIDIAVVNASDALARAELAKALSQKPNIQVLYLARDETELEAPSNPPKHFIQHKHLMADLVASLNRLAANVPALDFEKTERLQAIVPTMAPAPTGPSPAERAAAARAAVNIGTTQTPAAANISAIQKAVAANSVVPPPARIRLRALMVDSNPTVHAQLREVIESIGMKCDTAKSAAEALKQVMSNTYNIIYVDATTQEMDGYKLLREIKTNHNHKTTPMILLTSRAARFDAVQGAQAGCDTYLVKPVELKNFYTATVAALSKNIDHDEVSSLTRDPTVTLPVKRK